MICLFSASGNHLISSAFCVMSVYRCNKALMEWALSRFTVSLVAAEFCVIAKWLTLIPLQAYFADALIFPVVRLACTCPSAVCDEFHISLIFNFDFVLVMSRKWAAGSVEFDVVSLEFWQFFQCAFHVWSMSVLIILFFFL